MRPTASRCGSATAWFRCGVSPGEPVVTDRSQELTRLREENETLRRALDRRARWRRAIAVLLVILTSLSVVTASLAVWVHRTVFDTDKFMETIGPVLETPDSYTLIGDRASTAVVDALEIEARLAATLADLDLYLSEALVEALDPSDRALAVLERFDRPPLAALAPGIAAGLEDRIDNGIHAFFESDAFVSRVPELVERAHKATVALAQDDLAEFPNVYIEAGEVRLNLIPFIGSALNQVGAEIRAVLPDFDLPDVLSERVDEGREQVADAIQASLPPDFGQVTLMSEDSLTEVQTLVVQLDRYMWLTVILSIVILGATIAVSPNRRRTAFHLGIGVFAAIVVTSVVVRRLETAIVEQVVDPNGAALASDIVGRVISGLRTLSLLIALAALIVAVAAYLAGRPAWLEGARASWRSWTDDGAGVSRLDRRVAGNAELLRAGAIVLAMLVLFWVGLGLAVLIVIGILLVGSMLAISAAELRVAAEPVEDVVGE